VGFGSQAVLAGTMQLGDLVAVLMLTAFLYDPISRLHQLNQLVQAGRAAGERVFEILDEAMEPGINAEKDSVEEADSFSRLEREETRETVSFSYSRTRILGDIRYENVSFNYVEGLPALQNVSFHAP